MHTCTKGPETIHKLSAISQMIKNEGIRTDKCAAENAEVQAIRWFEESDWVAKVCDCYRV